MPPIRHDSLLEGRQASFVSNLVDVLNLTPILTTCNADDGRGQSPYYRAMSDGRLTAAEWKLEPESAQFPVHA